MNDFFYRQTLVVSIMLEGSKMLATGISNHKPPSYTPSMSESFNRWPIPHRTNYLFLNIFRCGGSCIYVLNLFSSLNTKFSAAFICMVPLIYKAKNAYMRLYVSLLFLWRVCRPFDLTRLEGLIFAVAENRWVTLRFDDFSVF